MDHFDIQEDRVAIQERTEHSPNISVTLLTLNPQLFKSLVLTMPIFPARFFFIIVTTALEDEAVRILL